MIRNIASVIVGYISIALTVFIGLTVAYMTLGSEGAFQPGVYELSATWVFTAVGVNFVAAIIGGIVCAKIARSPKTPLVFAIIVFILGLAVAVPALLAGDAETVARPEGITMVEAMKESQQPLWFLLGNPFIVAAGIMLGASLGRKKQHASSAGG